jgi:hypothetical protein
MRFSILLLLVAAFLVGCGGNGEKNGSTSDSQVPEQYMTALKNAVLTRDVDFIRQQIDTNYLDNCENKAGLVDAIMAVLGTSGTIDFTIFPITNKDVNVTRGRAEFDGGFRIEVTDGTETSSLMRTGRIVLRRDNGPWQLYGEQDCNQ